MLLQQEPPARGGTWIFGRGIGPVVLFAPLLSPDWQAVVAYKLVTLAQDAADLESNRADALIGIPVLAAHLPDHAKGSIFERVLPLTTRDIRLSKADEFFRETVHPYSRNRIDLGIRELHRSALIACASVATTADRAAIVLDLIMEWMTSTDSEDHRAVAAAVAQLDPTTANVQVRSLVFHTSAHIRAAAARYWSRDSSRDQVFADVFTRDRDPGVRLTLVNGLPNIAGTDRDLAEHIRAQLAHDPSARVRLATADYR
jgi:hypothetical protein